jgi:signal transduction histidine kinase
MRLDAAQRRLASLFPEPLLFVDRDGTIVEANEAAREFLERSREALVGLRLTDVFADDAEHIERFLVSCSRSNRFAAGSLTCRERNGELVTCRCEGGLLPASDGPGLIVVRHTPRRAATDSFVALNDQLSILQRVRHRLEANVSARTAELSEAGTRLRDLSSRLLHSQDEERRRLARELHDSTGQLLAAIQLNISLVQAQATGLPEEAQKRLSETTVIAQQAISEVRTMSYLLHPPMLDEAGLTLALRWFVEGFQERSHIHIDLEIAEGLERLPQGTETAIFRIVQEALSNIFRHSESSRATIRLAFQSNQLVLTVRDLGKGIPAAALQRSAQRRQNIGVGIQGMRERVRQLGGRIDVRAANPGTLVEVFLPIAEECKANRSAGAHC